MPVIAITRNTLTNLSSVSVKEGAQNGTVGLDMNLEPVKNIGA